MLFVRPADFKVGESKCQLFLLSACAIQSNDVTTAAINAIRDLEWIGARILKVKRRQVEPCMSAWISKCA
jgi:hypothetical protein